MKKIQLISYESYNLHMFEKYLKVSPIASPIAFDNFDINIIDLNCPEMWTSNFSLSDKVRADFNNIRSMFLNNSSVVIIIFPQNIIVGQYKTEAKNNLNNIKEKITTLCGYSGYDIFYENSFVDIMGEKVSAMFAFKPLSYKVTMSTKNTNKPVTINKDKFFITTIKIINKEKPEILFNFLKTIGLMKFEEDIPSWIYEYEFYNDTDLKNKIKEKELIIEDAKEEIMKCNVLLQQNMDVKKILYTNGEELVYQVFKILENIFEISLQDFIDDKHEDFLLKKDGYTFIGEIKGVTSNVKSEHISQLGVHVSQYNDKLQEENKKENIIPLLIINRERNKEIYNRNDIHENQIELAKKMDILILDTVVFLSKYEDILNEKLTRKDFINELINTTGILQ